MNRTTLRGSVSGRKNKRESAYIASGFVAIATTTWSGTVHFIQNLCLHETEVWGGILDFNPVCGLFSEIGAGGNAEQIEEVRLESVLFKNPEPLWAVSGGYANVARGLHVCVEARISHFI